jgi:hypothetical protein
MSSLVCPISDEIVNRNNARMTGFLMASMIALYAFTGSIGFIIAITIDFFIRGFTPLKFSPFSWIACKITKLLKFKEIAIDKAPKIFAARVGLLFSLTILVLYFINPLSSLIVALVLMGFALLESLFNFCVGCVFYSYLILPFYKKRHPQ